MLSNQSWNIFNCKTNSSTTLQRTQDLLHCFLVAGGKRTCLVGLAQLDSSRRASERWLFPSHQLECLPRVFDDERYLQAIGKYDMHVHLIRLAQDAVVVRRQRATYTRVLGQAKKINLKPCNSRRNPRARACHLHHHAFGLPTSCWLLQWITRELVLLSLQFERSRWFFRALANRVSNKVRM